MLGWNWGCVCLSASHLRPQQTYVGWQLDIDARPVTVDSVHDAEPPCVEIFGRIYKKKCYSVHFDRGDVMFNASDVEACRICLATDVKLYSLRDTHLGTCMESIGGSTNSCEGLPKYVCYECAPILLKSNKLIEKSKTAQATLLDVFEKNGQVTKTLIKDQNRSELNLQSSLDSYLLVNYYAMNNDDTNTSGFIQTKSVLIEKNNNKLEDEKPGVQIKEEKVEKLGLDESVEELTIENQLTDISEDFTKKDFISLTPYKVEGASADVLQKGQSPKGISQKFQPKPKNPEKQMRVLKRKLTDNPVSNIFTTEEIKVKRKLNNYPTKEFKDIRDSNLSLVMELRDIRQYFNVVNIPVNEQVTEWRQNLVKYVGSGFICNVCQKSFANAESLEAHSNCHDPSIHGNVRCEVCLLCFPTIERKEYHSQRVHANKFCCKFCPMVFNEMDDAKAHKISVCAGAMGLLGIRNPHIPGPRPLLAVPFNPPPPIRNRRDWYQRFW